jgi:ABC-type lipoprotein release transport system permease subunit
VGAAWFWWRATRRRTWRSTVVVALLCGILGAVALGALAGARRTESAYGRYLQSINASDAMVNIPSPDTSLTTRIAKLPGIRSSAAWVGLAAYPVVHGHVNTSFTTDALQGSLNGDFFTQDTMSVLQGHLPRLDATNQIALTASVARLFGVGVGGKVTYDFTNPVTDTPTAIGSSTYRVTAIVDFPPALVDQYDQVAAAVLPPAATALVRHEVAFSWIGLRLDRGSAGIPALQKSLARLATEVGGGYTFAIRQLDTVHQQVQDAIRPQAVALGAFGVLAALALLVLVGQSLAQLFDRSASQLGVLRSLGLTRVEATVASGVGPALAVLVGMVVAVLGAVALSPLAPVEPVRQFDPVRGVQFDVPVLLGGALILSMVVLGSLAGMAWRSVRVVGASRGPRPSAIGQAVAGTPVSAAAALGVRYALEPPPGGRRANVGINLLGSVAAVTAVVTAVVFGASLNGLVTHPVRYGWNWDVLIVAQGGYGDFLPPTVNRASFGSGDGTVDQLMAAQPGVKGWSTFGFTQLPIDGQDVPVLGLATRRGAVEPPTISGRAIDADGTVALGAPARHAPNQIELGATTLRQLHKRVGDVVLVGTGPTARRLKIVGVVTLPSIGVSLSDHVSLGRGAMLPETTLLAIENFSSIAGSPDEAFTALPSTLAIELEPGARAGPVVHAILSASPGNEPGQLYQQPRVLGAAIVNAGQMGGQPLALALALAVAVLVSLSAAVVASARRRRRDLAVLQAVGLTRRQLRSVIAWQTVTLLAIAGVLGLPLGIGAGHWAWSSFATSLGVVPVTAVPVVALVLGLLVLIGAGAALSAIPAVIPVNTATAAALRNE